MTTDRFFDEHQRATVAAAMARIIPTDDLPGAREAGAINFLDRYLSGLDHVLAKPDGSGFETLAGRQAQAWQQRIDILRQKYADGVRELDSRAQQAFAADFADLSQEQQDSVLTGIQAPPEALAEAQTTAAWAPVETPLQQTSVEVDLDFFPLLCMHTRQGCYADPIYGGNRDRVGWDWIGFPGPASLAEVHSGRYSVLAYFADPQGYPGTEGHRDA
jgi:gluconate 2-dehydrogenase gamma chain